MLKIATWNVNSIRARLPLFKKWIEENNYDVILLQELKCITDDFPYEFFKDYDYHLAVHGEKRYNGVAVLSKFPFHEIKRSLNFYNYISEDFESRFVECDFTYKNQLVKIASIYVPNGGHAVLEEGQKPDETEVFFKKLKFYDRLRMRFQETIENNEVAFFGGDFNTCPELMDMYNTKKDGQICCHPTERVKFKNFLDDGMSDIFRKLNPEKQEFTWWDYRTKGWENQRGLRLDAILSSPEATKNIKKCFIQAVGTRDQEKPSDHAPMVCEYDL